MVKRLETHQRQGKDKELREKAELVRLARVQDKEKKIKFFCSDDINWQNAIGNDLMDWSDLESSRTLDSFPLSRHLSPKRFYAMAAKNNYFCECLEYAKAKLGERMEEKLRDNPIYLSKALNLYSTLWIEAEEKKNEDTSKYQAQYQIVPLGVPVFKREE